MQDCSIVIVLDLLHQKSSSRLILSHPIFQAGLRASRALSSTSPTNAWAQNRSHVVANSLRTIGASWVIDDQQKRTTQKAVLAHKLCSTQNEHSWLLRVLQRLHLASKPSSHQVLKVSIQLRKKGVWLCAGTLQSVPCSVCDTWKPSKLLSPAMASIALALS